MATPTSVPPADNAAAERLADARRLFIERWARMAAHWGVPRSMAEVHALLFVEGRHFNTDELMARLGISRGNASMTVRTLVEWGIVTKTHCREDRRDYYCAEQDVMTLFATVIRVRKRREVDPLLTLVDECRAAVALVPRDGPDQAASRQAAELGRKLDDIDGFVRTFDVLAEHYLHAERQSIGQLFAALEAMR
jgi:DNA-binding transcriptional regulator GbsR (MarR family)